MSAHRAAMQLAEKNTRVINYFNGLVSDLFKK